MFAKKHLRAFTVTELITVVSGVGLLATIVLPLPQQLRQRQRLTGCLNNLSRIGAASLAYATEDPRNQITPMHTADVTDLMNYAGGFYPGPWGWRTVTPHVFGGQTATRPFPSGGVEHDTMLDEAWAPLANPWGAATRGLNPLVAAGGGSLETFHCPADTGYPVAAAGWSSPDIPTEAAGICCFEMLGNSYRSSRCGLATWGSGSGGGGVPSSAPLATFSTAPFGHTPEYVHEPQQTVLYSDPLFYSLVRQLASDADPPAPIVGWHGFLLADNVAYCDGSARLTEVGAVRHFSDPELQDMFCAEYGVSGLDALTFLRRGPGWQMDCYPAPGALSMAYYYCSSDHWPLLDHPPDALGSNGWPYDRYFENENPFSSQRGGAARSAVAPSRDQRSPSAASLGTLKLESHNGQWAAQ